MVLPTSSTGQSYPVVLGYQIAQQIGGGGFSRVFRAINPKAPVHRVAAIKVVSYAVPSSHSLRPQHPPDRQALRKEVQIHAVLKHPNVLEFLGVEEHLKEGSGKYVPGLYMVLELGAGGDLFDKIAPDVGVDSDLAHFYFSQLVNALEYIHNQGIAHRDIKPENLLLDAEGSLKLADFGLCSVYRYKGKERELKGACGSLPYIAPEMNGNPYRGEPADVWSTGVVLFALLVGNTPWDEPTNRSAEFVAYVKGKSYDPWPRIQGDALSLLRSMMCVIPSKRITIQEIKSHKWFTRKNPLLIDGHGPDAISLAERLLQGLIVSGDLDFNLHSDGKRATIPDSISLTQPELFGPGLDVQWNKLPPSSAFPAFRTNDARKIALSQQISARRSNVPSASLDGRGIAAGAAGSQFTQAMNHMTQWSSLAGGVARFSPHLTRLFCDATGPAVATLVIQALNSLSITHEVKPIGEDARGPNSSAASLSQVDEEQGEEQEVNDDPGDDDAMEVDVAAHQAKSKDVGSRGARIRVSTMDRRKCALRGEIWVESIAFEEHRDESEEMEKKSSSRTLILMRRSKGDPLEWRRLFRAIATFDGLKELVTTG
ncbi:hypothetical protein CBS101457_003745 [Exobasidium rhododendri]|nr:hypothetical protein CBS101457_003745 [Exobasidium rhododendri]